MFVVVGLGRGLGALIPAGPAADDASGARFEELPIDAIEPNPRQPREAFDEEALAELVSSVREVGVLQPVVVRELIAGALPAGDGRAALAGLPRGRPGDGARQSSATPPTTPCCVTRCWRTCTASSSTRWRRRRPTSSCWRSSGQPTRSSPSGSAGHARRSATRSGCSACRRPCSAEWRRACSAPATPARLLGLADAETQERLAARIVAEGLSVRATEELVATGERAG